ncbi:hypothetical protein B9Z19DRAFT_1068026 [Tuber borchii]|uniref:Uncharacterized protein n=1 Tax=Tuber borchii TaxID=42251 RepID=A0A2T6ZGQ3_TUBBO|nr:hypothetical protein B9Z19DRAFT_1068026 [Tuber borchii]
MDHVCFRNTFTPIVATPVKPVIAGANTPFALDEFSLVSFDQLGYPRPLPAGLADLPLYPDNHGLSSVNGPLDLTGLSPRTTHYPLAKEDGSWNDGSDVDITSFSSGTRHTTPHRPSYYWNLDNHGFYCVNGPVDPESSAERIVCFPHAKDGFTRIHGSDVDISLCYSISWGTAPHFPSYYLNHKAVSWFAIPPPSHITCYISLTKSSAVSHEQVQRGGVTPATSLAAPGEPHFRQSRH